MSLSVYNSLTNAREEFKALEPGRIGIYACGVTVYDLCHIGHAMQAIIYDVIRNYFRMLGHQVTYVRNYTDVDDKIIERAKEKGIGALELSEDMIDACRADMALLGVKPADVEPKVSDHIPEIVELIGELVANGTAYASGGDVYYSVNAYKDYGCLSNRSTDELLVGVRKDANSNKSNPLDFALWKKAKPGEISWPSPWGEGRPGWHIECSALAMKYLGQTFDIHGGGTDLIFPHHENENAQSVMATGKPFANYWIHNGLVTVAGKKMSKSAGNFLSIRDAVARYYPETIRFTILAHNYSSNIDFCEKSFYDAYSRLIYFYTTLQRVEALLAEYPDAPKTIPDGIVIPKIRENFIAAMNDNFNTTAAIREIGQVFKFINDLLTAKKPKLPQKIHTFAQVIAPLRECLATLTLLQADPAEAVARIQEYLIREKNIDVAWVENQVAERNAARAAKDWSRADEIRDSLGNGGISVMATPDGTVWQVQP